MLSRKIFIFNQFANKTMDLFTVTCIRKLIKSVGNELLLQSFLTKDISDFSKL